jgi:hypothetical protein
VDSLPHLERFLSGEKPMELAGIAQWRAIVSSATRRGPG